MGYQQTLIKVLAALVEKGWCEYTLKEGVPAIRLISEGLKHLEKGKLSDLFLEDRI